MSNLRMPRPKNALIVDDEPHVRAFLRLLLKEAGVEKTWEAGDGGQALEKINEHDPELVLLDMNMPVMTGLEVLAQIQEVRPELPVIVVSSENAIKTVQEAVRLGAVAYILKHSAKSEVIKTMRAAFDAIEAGEIGESGKGDEET